MARDFIRQVQQLRKDANLEIETRIAISYFDETAQITEMIREWAELIQGETLADSLDHATAAAPSALSVNVGDARIAVWIEAKEIG